MRESTSSHHYERASHMTLIVTPRSGHIERIIDIGAPTRDGTVLSSNVYLPAHGKPVPILLSMTVYRKELHKKHYEIFRRIPNTHLGTLRFSEDATFEGPDPAFWTSHGYGVIHVDARGFGKSQGKANPFSISAFEDYYDVIEWAAHQPWCNGNVGLSGVSYLGSSQYFVAAMRPPSLRAINPWDARTDRFRSDFLGGIPNTTMSRFIFENFTIPSLHDPAQADEMRRFVDVENAPHLIDDPVYAERNQLWRSIENIMVPTLIGGSVSDQAKHSRDAFENFMRIGSSKKWLYVHRDGEWEAYYDEEGLALQRRFFDHFLRKIDNGWDAIPPVIVHIHANRRRYQYLVSDEWPISGTIYRTLYLARDEKLSAVPVNEPCRCTYASDGSARVTFSIKFTESVSIVGHASLHLWFSIHAGADADVFVGLKKIDRDGDEVFFLGESGNNPNDIVSRGWIRASHRELATESVSWRPILKHHRQLPMEVGNPVGLEIEIHPTATSFLAGESLMLIIQGASIPPSDVAIGFEAKVNRGTHSVHLGGNYPSALRLPMVPHMPCHQGVRGPA